MGARLGRAVQATGLTLRRDDEVFMGKGQHADRPAGPPSGARGWREPEAPRGPTGLDTAGYVGTAPASSPPPAWQRRILVERPADLRAIVPVLSRAPVLALDAEFYQVRDRTPDEPAHRLSLVQIALAEPRLSYIVDALRIADLSPLHEPLHEPAILKLFHGIGADARVLAARGLVARGTLDLEAVSRTIFGQRESGLQTMLQRAAGVRLDKSLQRADWSRRPLTTAMRTYAARDAEMTLVLYDWLAANFPDEVGLHLTPGDESLPNIAAWIHPYLDGARPRPVALAVAEAGIGSDLPAQEHALRDALAAVRRPPQRARVMRLITDLELVRLAPDLRRYLTSTASEERAGAARALGRLHDTGAMNLIQPLLNDPVQDVRQAATLALEMLRGAPPASRQPFHPRGGAGSMSRAEPGGPLRWTSGYSSDEEPDDGADWRSKLRAGFSAPSLADDGSSDVG